MLLLWLSIGGAAAMAPPSSQQEPIDAEPHEPKQHEWSTSAFVQKWAAATTLGATFTFIQKSYRDACTTPGTIAGIEAPFTGRCALAVGGLTLGDMLVGLGLS